MVKYTDYTVLCCFVFPLGFAIPTLLALFEGREEREKGLCCILLKHKGCQGGWGSSGKLHHLAESGEKSPKTSPSCMLCPAFLGSRWIYFSLLWRAYLMGKTGHTGRLLGIWKPKLVKPRSNTKSYRRATAGRITFQRSSHGDSPLLR